MKHIFIVDDEKEIRILIKKYLEKEGYQVTLFSSGLQVYEEFLRLSPDLIVLDIMMPEVDGLELCKEIRKKSEIPIIFVSARGEEIDRVLGLEIGADDYLVKPFSPRELIVRIKNIFKRYNASNESTMKEESVKLLDVEINPQGRTVKVGEVPMTLTTKEFELFLFLAQNKNIPFTREQLLEKIWGYEYDGENRIIDDVIKRLRKKLKDMSSNLTITTVWGYGYKIED